MIMTRYINITLPPPYLLTPGDLLAILPGGPDWLLFARLEEVGSRRVGEGDLNICTVMIDNLPPYKYCPLILNRK